jgi:hypothetical protein
LEASSSSSNLRLLNCSYQTSMGETRDPDEFNPFTHDDESATPTATHIGQFEPATLLASISLPSLPSKHITRTCVCISISYMCAPPSLTGRLLTNSHVPPSGRGNPLSWASFDYSGMAFEPPILLARHPTLMSVVCLKVSINPTRGRSVTRQYAFLVGPQPR